MSYRNLPPGAYLEPDDPAIAPEIPAGCVVWVEGGVVRMEEDSGGSPCSWPIEDDGPDASYTIASTEDGTDVAIPRTMGSPGSDLAPDEIEEVRVRRLPPIGPRMQEALDFVKTHPGASKADVFRGTGARRNYIGIDPVDRLLRRNLVYDLGPDHRYVLYAWQEPEPENDGHWHPAAHP